MIAEFLSTLYLFWPLTFASFFLIFAAGFLFAISLGGLFAIGLLFLYYSYIYLKKRGYLQAAYDWLQSKHTLVGAKINDHVEKTFVLKGHLETPEGPVLYVAHPHGLFSMAPFLHWAAGATSWHQEKVVHIAIHSIFFKIPLIRELAEHFGAIEATDEEIRAVLERGESVALLTGGVREIADTTPGKMKLYLKKRKGFARIAKELGVPIVPVLTFGENELFPPVQGFWTDWIQLYLRCWFGISIPVPTFESLKNWFQLLRGPLPAQVETWIGTPVITKGETVDGVRKKVVLSFKELYQEGRPVGYPLEIEIA